MFKLGRKLSSHEIGELSRGMVVKKRYVVKKTIEAGTVIELNLVREGK